METEIAEQDMDKRARRYLITRTLVKQTETV